MKIAVLLTCMVFVFGWVSELQAQFLPVVANQRSISYVMQPDGTEIEAMREEGTYFRSSSGSVLDTMLEVKGERKGKHVAILMDSSTRKTMTVNHNLKEATLRQARAESFRPFVLRPDLAVDKGGIGGLDCLAMPVLSVDSPAESIGKVWWAKKANLRVKTETNCGRGRQVREFYEIGFAEPEPSVLRVPAHYKINDSTWTAETLLEVRAAGTPISQTAAGAEQEAFRSKQRSPLPDVVGKRLDGVEERLSDYRGRIVLLDFWATWCGPCVAALPKLRTLAAKLQADRFALIAISVDEEIGTVSRFIEDESMPWTHWHAGEGSDFARLLRIRSLPTYVLADENGKILTRSGGLHAPFISLIEEAVDHLGKFGSTQQLEFESIDLHSSLRDPDTLGGRARTMRDSFDMIHPAVMFGAVGVFILVIGLRGLVTKRPFLFSARWLLLFVLAMFLPPLVTVFPRPFLSPRPLQMMDWLPLLMFPILAVVFWLQMKGYLAIAVTGKSFRDGLLAALEKLQLPYEESLSSIRLTSVEAELQVAVQSWMGSGQIKVRPGRHGPLLKKIVQAMKEHFRTAAVETNMIFCVIFLVIGIFAVVMAMAMLFSLGLS